MPAFMSVLSARARDNNAVTGTCTDCDTFAPPVLVDGDVRISQSVAVAMYVGEKVGFGILVQLRLEERLGGNQLAAQARRQLLPLLQTLQLPVTLKDLGLGKAGLDQLQAACCFACRPGSDLHHLPFTVSDSDLLEALVSMETEAHDTHRQPMESQA